MHLNLPDSAQKKFWRPNFLKILTFYLVKLKPLALTRRVKKSTLLHTQCYIWHQNMKQNFISDLLIPFFFRPGASKGFWSHFSIFFLDFCIFYRFCRRKSRQVYSHTPGALKKFAPTTTRRCSGSTQSKAQFHQSPPWPHLVGGLDHSWLEWSHILIAWKVLYCEKAMCSGL